MSAQSPIAEQGRPRPGCNVNQTFNFGVGVVAVVVAAVVTYFLLK